MLEKLLEGGFNEEKSLEIINSVIKLKTNENSFSTVDAFIFNLRTANAEFVKLGSAPTYIIEDGKVITINSSSLPVGVIKDTDYLPIAKQLKEGTVVVQISDGVVEEEIDVNDNYFKTHLQNIDISKTSKAISEELRKFVIKEKKGLLDDDFTIMVSKVIKS